MAAVTNSTADRISRGVLGTLIFALYIEAFVVAVPIVLLSLVAFDQLNISWFGTFAAVGLLGVTLLAGAISLFSLIQRDEWQRTAILAFAASWAVYNGVGVLLALSL